jgi:sorbitol-specific phosphotransferase system component IIBC
MDTGKTNGNNIAQWSDRTLTTTITQDINVASPRIQVVSITDAATISSAFSGDWKVKQTKQKTKNKKQKTKNKKQKTKNKKQKTKKKNTAKIIHVFRFSLRRQQTTDM